MSFSFDAFIAAYLETLACRLEQVGFEVDLTDLTLSFTLDEEPMPYLIKIHRRNQELWFSSPISGGNRFVLELASGLWKNIRTHQAHQDFDLFLHEELSQKNINFPPVS